MDKNDDAARTVEDEVVDDAVPDTDKFYADASSAPTDMSDGDLFAELYGHQDKERDTAARPEQPPAQPPPGELETAPASAEELSNVGAESQPEPEGNGSDDDETEGSTDDSDDDSEQDVKIVLIGNNDLSRAPTQTVRVAPNKYVRAVSEQADAAAAAAAVAAPAPAAPTDTLTNELEVEAPVVAKPEKPDIATLIPPEPAPIDRLTGRPITFPSVYDVDIDALPEKPWKHHLADLSDWFNYGFDENSWRTYCQRQVQMRLTVSKQVKPRSSQGGHAGRHAGHRGGPPSIAS
ncbi:hypothetical protein PBRA_005986 [Plasmodiophora brassicae]|uniref:Pre-mRNA polyadenylation factor Fip1 domain-containing protein n=1 Tax=Plasmodiophora brassicae TaxID=37360 RepID=A0A0G4IRQ2_PLABS|nr:hypothetical protein PBRA_005986 [Plasmodiophora brassicae]